MKTNEWGMEPGSWLRRDNRLTELLGIRFPIIQGPLGGLASQRLTAAVSNLGGLGSFGAHSLTPQAIREVVAEIRGLTAGPFAMNLWVSMEDDGARDSDAIAFQKALSHIAPGIRKLEGTLPAYEPYTPRSFEAQARILLDENVPIFSFIFGIPGREILKECRARKITTLGTATTVDEARALDASGVDAIVASGFEAGGHRGSFLKPSEESLTGTFALVRQIVRAVSVPVIAAGGITDAEGIAAAMALGAEGVQMGTVFLPLEESGANPMHRRILLETANIETALTRGFTGRLARGIRNQVMDEWNATPADILPYPLQRQLMRSLSNVALEAGDAQFLPMWAGQNAGLVRHRDLSSLWHSLILPFGAQRE